MAYPGAISRRTGRILMSDQPGPDQPQLNPSDPGQTGPQLALMLEPDLKSMHLRIGQDAKLMAGIVLSADNLDGLLENLMQIRDRMLPAPPARPAPPAAGQLSPVEPAPTEFSPDLAREIKGTHYDFGISGNGQQLIFSVRDEGLGWLSFRFGARLLERMLRVVNSPPTPPSPARAHRARPGNAAGC
jgi:hypothetical protein